MTFYSSQTTNVTKLDNFKTNVNNLRKRKQTQHRISMHMTFYFV